MWIKKESEMVMKSNCPVCKTTVKHFILKRIEAHEAATKLFGKLSIKWEVETAYCKDCRTELTVNSIEVANKERFLEAIKAEQRKVISWI